MNTIQPLNSQLALNQCSGLNIEGNQTVSGVFGNGVPVQSNSGDPELILIVKFKNNINLNQILIETGMDKEKAPEYLKVFAHRDDLDFADAEEMAPTDSFKLEGNFGKKLTVKIPKFKNLSTLCVNFFLNL